MNTMTKFFFTLCLCFSAGILLAQSTTPPIGFRVGIGSANVRQTDLLDEATPDFNAITSYSMAVFTDIQLTEHLAFQPELAYTRKGFALKQDIGLDLFNVPLPVGVQAKSQFNYLEAPLLLKGIFGDEVVQGYVLAGPSVGYATNGRLKTEASGLLDINISNTKIDLESINYERFELSGIIGAGAAFATSFGKLYVDGRYQHGFTELYDIPLVSEKVMNRGLSLNVGMAVGF